MKRNRLQQVKTGQVRLAKRSEQVKIGQVCPAKNWSKQLRIGQNRVKIGSNCATCPSEHQNSKGRSLEIAVIF